MGRLIDADALIESFRKCYSGHLGMENSDSMMTFKSICRIINEQPTVYDVEKVVAELEELEQSRLEMHDWQGQSVASDAIDIVKRGGVE